MQKNKVSQTPANLIDKQPLLPDEWGFQEGKTFFPLSPASIGG